MSELRQNLASKEWVVIAPHRREKPDAIKTKVVRAMDPAEEHSSECPFCPDNEERFPVKEITRIAGTDGQWNVRVIENKYKILDSFDSCPAIAEPFEEEGIYKKLKGCGSHELILGTPKHNKTIMDLSVLEIKKILQVARLRYVELEKNPNNLITIIFINYGAMSGQTQPHSHMQIVGSRVVPYYIRSLLHESEKHFDSFGTCVFCDMLKFELNEKKRLVYENDSYCVFVPFAAGSEHEAWILPKSHSAGFDSVSEQHLYSLAEVMKNLFCGFKIALENPDFNFVIRTPPYPLSNVPYFHWHIQHLPRTKLIGGFKYGTRIQVNTILPEESAKLLKECVECKEAKEAIL